MNQEKTMITHFQFRLNGVIIPRLIVRPIVRNGITIAWDLLACDEKVGTFAIDDNEQCTDPALPRFILEVKDLAAPIPERKLLPNKGWKRISTKSCMALLESARMIDRSE